MRNSPVSAAPGTPEDHEMSETDWKVVRTDEHPVLDEKDLEIMRLRAERDELKKALEKVHTVLSTFLRGL